MKQQLTHQQQTLTDNIHALVIQVAGRPLGQCTSEEITSLAASVINVGVALLRVAQVPARSVACYLRKLANEYAQNCPCANCTGANVVRVNAPGGQS